MPSTRHVSPLALCLQVEEDPRYPVMYTPRGQAAGLLSTPSVPCPEMTRFLPYEDAIVKAYKETRFRFFGPASRRCQWYTWFSY